MLFGRCTVGYVGTSKWLMLPMYGFTYSMGDFMAPTLLFACGVHEPNRNREARTTNVDLYTSSYNNDFIFLGIKIIIRHDSNRFHLSLSNKSANPYKSCLTKQNIENIPNYFFSVEKEYGKSAVWIPRCLFGWSSISISNTAPFIKSL